MEALIRVLFLYQKNDEEIYGGYTVVYSILLFGNTLIWRTETNA